MSTFIWRIAMKDVNTTAITATRIVTGRRMAVNTNHMRYLPPSPAEAGHDVLVGRSWFDPVGERRQIAVRLRRRQQRTPHAEPRDSIIRFCLREQALRFRHFDDAGEAVLIACARLTLASRRGLPFGRRVSRDRGRGLHQC